MGARCPELMSLLDSFRTTPSTAILPCSSATSGGGVWKQSKKQGCPSALLPIVVFQPAL